jgi:transcriptional regulator with XRE-family HTH domain
MASPKQPTVGGRGLGWDLRSLREDKGLSLRAVSRQLEWPASKVSRIETGKQGIRTEDVASLLVVYGITGEQREQLLERTARADEQGLWEIQRGIAKESNTLIRLEGQAKRILNAEPLWLPGLLQTPDYTRAVMQACGVADSDIETRLAARMSRQAILSRTDKPALDFAIDEGALRRKVLPSRLMARQLRYIEEAAERPNVTLWVIPASIGAHTGMDGPFTVLTLTKNKSVVFLEHKLSWLFLEKDFEVNFYSQEADRLKQSALQHDKSVQLVQTIAKELEGE